MSLPFFTDRWKKGMMVCMMARIFVLTLATLCLAHPSYNVDGEEVIERDVVVIGGGSSGTYTAIRLQQCNKTVALVEKEDKLGGHVDTYVDPATDATFDYGVVIFDGANTVVRDYFASLNIPTASLGDSGGGAKPSEFLFNFADGTKVSAKVTQQGNITDAISTYLAELAKYPYLDTGYNLPAPVPADLLLTFGDFVKKYSLEPLVYLFWQYLQGVGNILDQTALYILKYAPVATVTNIIKGGFITTARHNNQELYDTALARLGPNAFLNSHVTNVTRYESKVRVHVSAPGHPKLLIQASKLVISIPPTLQNLKPFLDLGGQETVLFSEFNNTYYWDSVLKDSGIPDGVEVKNLAPAAPYGVPASPGLYVNSPSSIPGLRAVWYSSPFYLTDDEVKADILAANARLIRSLGYDHNGSTQPEFVGFNAHNPFELTVSTEAIKNGFYTELESLQGQLNTWWTGATWQGAHDSSLIWKYTERKVLPGLLASLDEVRA